MNARQHAVLARDLIDACGGLVEASKNCRLGKSQLSDFQNPNVEAWMPADVIADLERYCRKPLYSQALVEAADPDQADFESLKDEACDAVEATAGLLKKIRDALADGQLTPAERDALLRDQAAAMRELQGVGRILAGEEG